VAGVLSEVGFYQAPLGFLHHFTNELEAVLRRHRHHSHNQALRVRATRVQRGRFMGESQSFDHVVRLHGVVGQFLGAPLRIVPVPRIGLFREPAVGGQLRQPRVRLLDALEALPADQGLNLAQGSLRGERVLRAWGGAGDGACAAWACFSRRILSRRSFALWGSRRSSAIGTASIAIRSGWRHFVRPP
jgi:hypothetical protein